MASVEAAINYVAPTGERPRYHANDISRDRLTIDAQIRSIEDARLSPPSLDREGFVLVKAPTRAGDLRDPASADVHRSEIEALVLHLSGADAAVVTGNGVLRFGERSQDSGRLNNSRPARFAHVDISDVTALEFAARSNPRPDQRWQRFAHYNVWRALTPPPQDVPLALCDARSVRAEDLIAADAVFDVAGEPDWSFEGFVVAASPVHRWIWFPDMTSDEVIVFKTNDSNRMHPVCVPHVAFDAPNCPDGTPPRGSIEMRAIAYWYD